MGIPRAGNSFRDHPGLGRRRAVAPTTDLVSIAFAIVALIEGGPWRVSDVATGSDLPEVWLRRDDPNVVNAALNSVTGCITIDGALSPAESPHAGAQQLTVFLAEFSDSNAASTIATLGGPGSPGGFAGLGVAAGRVCAVLVSRSLMDGIESYEDQNSLERFRAGLLASLTNNPA